MKFKIIGAARGTGEDSVLELDAPDAAEAEKRANRIGVLVSAVETLIEQTVLMPTPHSPQSSCDGPLLGKQAGGVILGGTGEPYCCPACSSAANNSIFEVTLGSQQGRHARCILCQSPSQTGRGLALTRNKQVILFCEACIRGGGVRSYTSSLQQCSWCGKNVDRSFRSLPGAIVSQSSKGWYELDKTLFEKYLTSMMTSPEIPETSGVWSAINDLERILAWYFGQAELATITLNPNYIKWSGDVCDWYLLRTAESKWQVLSPTCSFSDGKPIDLPAFNNAIKALTSPKASKKASSGRKTGRRS